MNNIFSYILLNVFNWRYQTYSIKEFQKLFYFLLDCLGEVIIESVQNITSFVSAVGFLVAKHCTKKGENSILIDVINRILI